MRLKILIMSHKFFPDIGGIEVHSEMLANAFTKDGHLVHVVTWSKGLSGKSFAYSIIRHPGIVQLFKEHQWADVILENNPSLRLSWPNLFFKRPLVIALHTWISRSSGKVHWQDRLKRKWLNRAQKVIACSDVVRQRCYPSSIVIHNPFEDGKFKVLSNISKTRDFVFVGRLVTDKGAALAIEAIKKMGCGQFEGVSVRPASSLTIVGDGPELAHLRAFTKKLGLTHRVDFVGPLQGEALVKCLNMHRYMLVPSVWEEPFGIVALEGMACGCVPVVAKSGGLPEAIGNAGLIFEKGNVDDLINNLKLLINNSSLEEELKKLANNHLHKHKQAFITKRYLEVLEMAVAAFKKS